MTQRPTETMRLIPVLQPRQEKWLEAQNSLEHLPTFRCLFRPPPTSAITISTWVNFTGGDTYSGLFSSRDGSTGSSFSGITFDNSGGTPQYLIGTWNGSQHLSSTLNQVYTHAGSWVYVAMTVTGNTMVLYVGADGTVYSDTATISGSSYSNTFGFRLGQDNGPGLTRYMTGSFDEARIAYTARSADWIATEYSNQSNPGDFYSVGP
jgi:hypothetical protein